LYLSFSLFSDRIVIDSNEDGFREEHVRAICSTGESTKTEAKGYIGEKGIGFKSVFKVAKKVHIQSGPFSFSFEHTRDSDDDGLGMVTPLNETHEDLPDNVRTRMTLTLLDPSAHAQRVVDLENIPDTLLLFLTKLRVLNINIHRVFGSGSTTQYKRSMDTARGVERISRNLVNRGVLDNTTKDYYVTKRQAKGLPHDEARKYTNEAEVVLAFPVSPYDVPVVAQQHVFAYLPLRMAGFTVCFSFTASSTFICIFSDENLSSS
jgi:hypothetical protein